MLVQGYTGRHWDWSPDILASIQASALSPIKCVHSSFSFIPQEWGSLNRVDMTKA